jgi:uncharacterized Zn finger protein
MMLYCPDCDRLLRDEQSVGTGGLTAPRPTGKVQCRECGAVHTNIDDIPHAKRCSQRFVRSRWYLEMLDGRCGGRRG